MAHYVDTSALVKLVVAEPETAALQAWFASSDRTPVTSDLSRTELMRAVRRVAPRLATGVRDVLESMILVRVRTSLFEAAGRLDPDELRALDAVHLASALDLGDDLDAVVTYDARLASAAEAYGLAVVAPR